MLDAVGVTTAWKTGREVGVVIAASRAIRSNGRIVRDGRPWRRQAGSRGSRGSRGCTTLLAVNFTLDWRLSESKGIGYDLPECLEDR